MSWPIVKLGEVLTFIRGITFKPEEKIEASHPDAVVCMRTKNIQEELDESDLIAVPKALVKREELFLRHGDILISSANSWNLVGKVVQVPRLDYQATAGGFISILRPVLDKVLPDYLYLFINSEQVQHDIRLLGKQTTNISNLDRKRFLELEIPLPPISIQTRIAEILMQGRALLKQSIQMESELNLLIQNVFFELFGDPLNSNNLNNIPFGLILDEIESGWSPKCEDKAASEGVWGVLKLSAVTQGMYKDTENKQLPLNLSPKDRIEVKNGDLLFTRKNTKELVATVAYVRKTRPKLMLSDLIFRFKLKANKKVSKVYLYGLFSNEKFRGYVQSLASGAAGSMPNISKSKLWGLNIPLPSYQQQLKYEDIVFALWNELDLLHAIQQEYMSLFDALIQRLFFSTLEFKSVA